MKKVLLYALLLSLIDGSVRADRELTITGPLVAPWVKGNLCVHYKQVHDCLSIGAGKMYRFVLPDYISRIKVTRSFAKRCKKSRRGKVVCDSVHGRFNVSDSGELVLTNDKFKIYKFYTIPPEEPKSNYGWPQYRDPSIAFRHVQMSDPTSVL